jgi:hypothetical protein
MSSHIMMFRGKSVRAVVLLAALAAALATGVREQARAGGSSPSPFAGHYDVGNGQCRITISDSGRISDSEHALSGRITDDGLMTLTVPFNIGWGVPPGRHGGGGRSTVTFEGIAALDEYGNLHGVLTHQNRYGVVLTLGVFWLRCG